MQKGTDKTSLNIFDNGQLLLTIGSILLLTYISFSPSLKNGFINWDDNACVFANPNLAKRIPEAIKYYAGPNYVIGNYVPLTMMVYTIEYHLAELDPHFYHLVNLLIHLINVLLVFWFIYLLSEKKLFVAALVAFFFGVHPLHVESVAWIAELKDVLYSAFFLAGLISYCRFLTSISIGTKKQFPFYVFFFFMLSVLSKPAAIIFPVVLLLIDFYKGRKLDKGTWLEKLPFFIVSVIFGIIAIKAQQADGLLHEFYPVGQRVLFASHSFVVYLYKFFLPVNLSIFYPYPTLTAGQLPPYFYFPPLVVLILLYLVFRTLRQSRLVAFGFLFFAVNLVLALQIVTVGDAILAERYTYIPYIGLLFVIGMLSESLLLKNKMKGLRSTAIVGLLALGFACCILTSMRCKVWKTDDTVATDLLKKFPEDWLALNNKGYILFEQKRYEESIELLKKAIQLKPDYIRAHINLANSYLAIDQYENALKIADQASKVAPEDINVLNKKGTILFLLKNYPEAMKAYNEAIRLKKDNSNAYLYLSECYFALRDYDKGIKTTALALQFDPQNHFLLNNMGYFLYLQGKYAEALNFFKAALASNPGYTTAQVNLEDCTRALEAARQNTQH
jgi:tetratricopeptide (TPR) repeat protein